MRWKAIIVHQNYLHGLISFLDSKLNLIVSSFDDLIHEYLTLVSQCSKQRGPEAEKANNVFYHLSYYDAEDLAQVEDQNLRAEIELHIADFGNCPSQLFFKAHPLKRVDSLVTQSKVSLLFPCS